MKYWLIQELEKESKLFFNKKEFINAGQINRAIDVLADAYPTAAPIPHLSEAKVDINNPEFEKTEKVHDWRNYVPNEWRQVWHQFTDREKKIIYTLCNWQADKEEWD